MHGIDRIRNEMLKCGRIKLLSVLVRLFNLVLKSGNYPDIWLNGVITSIYKSGDRSDPSNYRGICVSSCLGKLFCSILNTRLQAFLKNKEVLHPSQIGFLPGNRTADHIFSLHTLIDKYVTNTTQGKRFCCFVDFRKAFDSIWHPGLLKKLLNYKIGGQFFRLISTMYSKTLCCIKSGNMRSAYFKYNRGVRQGCILSPLLFNLYLNDLPLLLQNIDGPDPITLPNGSLLNSLFYADDLVLISTSASGLQKCINSMQQYCKDWMMSVNTKKTKVVIFQKKTRKSTLQKYSFFLNDSQIDIVQDYTYLGSTISSNGSFSNSKLKSVDKTRRSIFATKRFLDFSNLPIRICNRLFDALFSPILLYNSEIWGAYDSLNFEKWEKDPVERLHSQFFKLYLGLNKRAPNVAARNEVGRISLKSLIYRNMLRFWMHLQDLPTESIAKQCLSISNTLALHDNPSFMTSINKIIETFQDISDTNPLLVENSQKPMNYFLNRIIKKMKSESKVHQMKLVQLNIKLNFYSKFTNDTRSSSNCYDVIKNMKHRRTLAKFRTGNHCLRIETGRHAKPKIPRDLRHCECCLSNDVEDEIHFFFDCVSYSDLRNSLFKEISKHCKSFLNLQDTDRINFFFNNVDPFICKQLGHFIYEASERRNTLLARTVIPLF